MSVNPGDTLFTYVYIPSSPYRPDTLVLQWYDDASGWTHRAYWGIDSRDQIMQKTSLEGAAISMEGWRYMGPIPASGQWVRLEVPASYVGLEGKLVKGMAFGIYQKNKNGRAIRDYSGKTSSAPTNQSQIPALKFTTPLWRYKCGSGSSERFYYTPLKDHNFFSIDCVSGVNSGFVYGYPAPGTTVLHSWQNPQGRWLLNACQSCVGGDWIYRWPIAHMPIDNSMTDTVVHKYYSCNNNPYYTTYPNSPDTLPPPFGCSLTFDTYPFVHSR
jgi:hypothetical protein